MQKFHPKSVHNFRVILLTNKQNDHIHGRSHRVEMLQLSPCTCAS